MTDVEEADRLSQRRARIMPVLGFFLILQQATFFATPDRMRTVDLVRAGAWVLLASIVLAALVSGGFWLRSRAVRQLMDDDVTRSNRSSALKVGFIASTVTAIVLYAVEAFAHGTLSAPQAIHGIVTIGLLGALLRFAFLERRALG